MRKQTFDGVVEAVRIDAAGSITFARVYERRGAIFFDHTVVSRDELIRRIKAGKRYMIGKREAFLAGTFKVKAPIWLDEKDGMEFLVIDPQREKWDNLPGVKFF